MIILHGYARKSGCMLSTYAPKIWHFQGLWSVLKQKPNVDLINTDTRNTFFLQAHLLWLSMLQTKTISRQHLKAFWLFSENSQLTLMLGQNFSWKFEIVFLFFFLENRVWYFMQIVFSGVNMHEMSTPTFSVKKNTLKFAVFWICPECYVLLAFPLKHLHWTHLKWNANLKPYFYHQLNITCLSSAGFTLCKVKVNTRYPLNLNLTFSWKNSDGLKMFAHVYVSVVFFWVFLQLQVSRVLFYVFLWQVHEKPHQHTGARQQMSQRKELLTGQPIVCLLLVIPTGKKCIY